MTQHPQPVAASARLDAGEWVQTLLLAANLVWTTLCLGGYFPRTQVVTTALTGLLLIAHFVTRAIGRTNAPIHPAGWVILPFVAYAAINAAWISTVPWLGWQDWYQWAQMAAVFWVVLNGVRSRTAQHVLFGVVLALGVVGVFLACYQRYVDADWLMLGRTKSIYFRGQSTGSFGIPNNLAALLILLLPPSAALAFRRSATAVERVLFGWLVIVFSVGLVLAVSRGGWLALVLALVVWPFLARSGSARRRVLVALLVLIISAAATVTAFYSVARIRERVTTFLRDSGERTRPMMWRAAWKIFREHPTWGSGAGSYNVEFEKHRPDGERGQPQWAHNEYLNTLSDYGLVGFVLCFGAAGVIVIRCTRNRVTSVAEPPRRRSKESVFAYRSVQAGMMTGFMAFALQAGVDFHLKIPALALTFTTVAGIWVSRRWTWKERQNAQVRPPPRSLSRQTMVPLGVALAVAMVWMTWVMPRIRAEGIRFDIRAEIDTMASNSFASAEISRLAHRAVVELSRAVEIDPANAQGWADRAYAIAVLAHEDAAHDMAFGLRAEADAMRALALTRHVAEFWLRKGVALDLQDRWLEAGEAFTEALRLAPATPSSWFYYAYHLALNPVAVPLAHSAVATCLRLDPWNREAEGLRRKLSAGR